MASGYKAANGLDLDSVFIARTGAARGNVGYKVGGVDISNRYEQIGGATPTAQITGFRYQSADLATLFKAPGGTPTPPVIIIDDGTFNIYSPGACRYRLTNLGWIEIFDQNLSGFVGYWCQPSTSAPGPYRVRATSLGFQLNGGTFTHSGFGTWWPLTTTREWNLTRTTDGYSIADFRLEIDAGDGVVLDQAQIRLEVLD